MPIPNNVCVMMLFFISYRSICFQMNVDDGSLVFRNTFHFHLLKIQNSMNGSFIQMHSFDVSKLLHCVTLIFT